MKVMTKEERENLVIGGIGLLVIAGIVGAILYVAVGLVALLVVGGGLGAIALTSLALNLPKLREYRQLARKTRIVQLEAAAGLAVVQYEGKCRHCGHQLVLGAQHCTSCGKATENKPKVCDSCAAVNPEDALYCSGCGKFF